MKVVNGKTLAAMFVEGAHRLKANAARVDALNVFPVPDGDTGTNMNLTMSSGVKEIEHAGLSHAGAAAKTFSKGLLMGARGNSGVILSQLFRGFAKGVELEDELNGENTAKALQSGVDMAYQAVMKPVEGTILTVAKDAAKAAKKAASNSSGVEGVLNAAYEESQAALERTQDQLPALKEAGVVDSGGQGLVYIYQGMLAYLRGEERPEIDEGQVLESEENFDAAHQNLHDQLDPADIEYGYCTEFMVRLSEDSQPFDEHVFRRDIGRFGDSLLVVSDEDLVKVHIHAEHPGEAMTLAQKHGSLMNIKIENMREQHAALNHRENQEEQPAEAPVVPEGAYGIVTVSMGDGIKALFQSLGATQVIEGGQTMNPSTEDIVAAIEASTSETVFVFPNNSNIVMTAEQAAEVADKDVRVIPSKSVPQGMAALFVYDSTLAADELESTMNESLKEVRTGQVTWAVRDTSLNGREINEGDFMAMVEKDIAATSPSLETAVLEFLPQLISEDVEIVTVLAGADADSAVTEAIKTYIEENYRDVELEVHEGGQPIYPYIFAAE
ncbi:hypothetical protein B0H94_10159 [Salsuginibacillus halophilus]|uniref:DhaL domain-containing protein n=2 Tax=Salsuginibacillus halophilus TaxID=517424 RepID=A0A2P8HY62_9BACI|nr:hypothetical protein B0H94_10159 [Salsuginibacillus halophilus]